MEGATGGDAVKVLDDEFITLLKKLDLYKYYPNKLTRDDVFGLINEELDDSKIEDTKDLCKFFLHRLRSCNYKARDLEIIPDETSDFSHSVRNRNRSPSTSGTPTPTIGQLFGFRCNQAQSIPVISASHDVEHHANAIHPQDLIVSIYMCSDPILKQDIANLLWRCKLAIPFITHTHIDDIPIAHVWAIKSICAKWSYRQNERLMVEEDTVVSPCFLTIGVFRFQSNSVHKSSLINAVMGDTDRTHSIFYHRDAIGSIPRRVIAEGMVEISWYLPNGSEDNMYHEPLTILNLRGDAAKYPRQMQVLVEMMSICIIVCPSQDLADENNQNIVQAIRNKNKLMIIVMYDDNETKAMQIMRVDNNLIILNTRSLTKAKLKENIKSFLKEQTANNSLIRTSVENFTWTDILVDQDQKEVKDGLIQAEVIMKLMLHVKKENRKDTFLPLHQRLWRNWVDADKEIHRLKKIPKNKSIDEYRNEKEMEKVSIRRQQSNMIQNGVSEVIISFLRALSINEKVTRIVCVRWLRIQLDKTSRLDIKQLLEEETEIHEKIKAITDQAEKKTFQEVLENLQEMQNKCHIGIEHLFRELGQIYEAIQAQTPEKRYDIGYDLPLLAARFLLDGNSLEIFDGDIGSVPITWTSAVFERLSGLVTKHIGIKDPKCSVLTVYGMQSSGKSTLLNTMFGCQFPVSAGRCTRGAQVQMLNVIVGDQQHVSVDYILLIDTEGVRSPDMREEVRRLRDNEITTFVVGLGDKTLINLMGENTSFLTEVLPIAVRAFLRMGSVGLHPSCAIVYQNVDSQSDAQMSNQNRKLQEELDSQTRTACQMETKEEKRFKEVIDFDIENDIHYIPSLWEGEQPMSPIAHGYSKGTSRLKSSFKKFCKKCKSHYLSEYSSHVKSLWTAISKDDFVYFFRNTLETEARQRLDKYWCNVVWDLRMKARQCESELHIDIMNSRDPQNLMEISQISRFKIRKEVTDCFEKLQVKLKDFFLETPQRYEQYMCQWEASSINGLSKTMEELIEDLKSEIMRLQRLKECQFTVETKVKEFREWITNNIVEFFKEERKKAENIQGNLLPTDEIKKNFNAKWTGWLQDVAQLCDIRVQERNIAREALDILREKFPSHEALVIQKSHTLSSGKIDKFKLSEAHLIKKSEDISGQIKIKFEQIVDNAMEKVSQRLQELTKDPTPYTKGSLEEIIKIVSDAGDNIEEYGVCTTNEFQIEIAMTASSMAIAEFTKSEKALFESFDPIHLLEKAKDDFFILFQTNYKKTSFTRSFASRVSDLLISTIKGKIDVDIVREAADSMRTRVYTSVLNNKKSFIYTILCKIAEEGIFTGFMDYLKNPTTTIEHWLGRYFDEYSSAKGANASELRCLLDSMVTIHQNSIVAYVNDTAKALNKGKNAVEMSNANDIKVQQWVDEFTDMASKTFIVDQIRNSSEIFVNESVDLQYFTSELLKQLAIKTPNLDDITTPDNTSYDNIRKRVVANLRDLVVGCTESCPFCAEICVSSKPNHHPEPHETPVHRPQGCTGYTHIWDNTLVIESCQKLVANPEKQFLNERTNGEFVHYKDYQTIYKEWKIPGDPNPLTSTFWECVFAKYIKDLENEHGASPTNIPEVWETYTIQGEIEKLTIGMSK